MVNPTYNTTWSMMSFLPSSLTHLSFCLPHTVHANNTKLFEVPQEVWCSSTSPVPLLMLSFTLSEFIYPYPFHLSFHDALSHLCH